MKSLLHESPVTDRTAVKNPATISGFDLLANQSSDDEDDLPSTFTDGDDGVGD